MAYCAACGTENPDEAQFCMRCATPLESAARRDQRKTVTVVFCDVVGSTALGESADPEAVKRLLERYFGRMRSIVERHGGTVEKFIGDAVVAVFGVPVAHEDDGLRALRAATEMRDALPELQVQARIGVNTGEIVTSGYGTLVIGDAINVAARLEQAAEPGDILVGAPTLALVGEAARVEEVEPLRVKGKAEPVAAGRLVSVLQSPERSHASRFVGREEELAEIVGAWSRAKTHARCELLTIVGEAGVGKSRLVSEALARIDARVVRGRCLPYGEGITFWPVVEVVKQLDTLPEDPKAASAIRSLLGESERPSSTEEIGWAFRKLLEESAPLVCVFDDLQWAEETFLDLVETIARMSSGSALFALCMARPELLGRRPTWLAPLRLEGLDPLEADELIGDLVSGDLRGRIARAAGGNPLFITEMLAMVDEDGSVDVPPTLKAVLSMRLDQLDADERRVLECGAVEGEVFHRSGVLTLAPEQAKVESVLAALVRRQLIRPDRPEFPGDEGFRFLHLLIRDAAYEAIPKVARADLHLRMADRLEADAEAAVVGYHLEQAYRLRSDLASPDAMLAHRAGRLLRTAGEQALSRTDLRAAIAFFVRALPLLPADEAARLLPELGQALFESGRFAEADEVDREAVARAGSNPVVEARARVEHQFVQLQAEPLEGVERAERVATESLDVFVRFLDERGQCRASCLLAWIAWNLGQTTRADEIWERAAGYARDIGDARELFEILGWRASAALYGRTPVPDAIRRCTEIREQVESSPVAVAVINLTLAALRAMEGDFDEARGLVGRANVVLADVGRLHSAVSHQEAMVEMLAGDPASAEGILRAGFGKLEAMGEKALLATTAALLARAIYAQGRDDEADDLCAFSERTAAEEDIASQVTWRGVRAKIAARQGRSEEAETLALEAVLLVAETDMLNRHGEALLDLAEAYWLSGRPVEADAAARAASVLFTEKGNVVLAARTQSFMMFPIPP